MFQIKKKKKIFSTKKITMLNKPKKIVIIIQKNLKIKTK